MANLAIKLSPTAKRLLTREAQGATVYTSPASGGDPFTPPSGRIDYLVSAVQYQGQKKNEYISGGYIQATDILLAVAPFDVAPDMAGTMSINGETFQIIMIDSPTIEPSAPVAWFIGCRK